MTGYVIVFRQTQFSSRTTQVAYHFIFGGYDVFTILVCLLLLIEPMFTFGIKSNSCLKCRQPYTVFTQSHRDCIHRSPLHNTVKKNNGYFNVPDKCRIDVLYISIIVICNEEYFEYSTQSQR